MIDTFALDDGEVRALGESGWFVRDRLLGGAAARAAHGEAARLAEAAHPAGLGRGGARRLDPAVRGDSTRWLSPTEIGPSLSPLWARFESLAEALRRDAWLGIDRFDVQLARYSGDGARYERHADAFAGGPSRRVSAIYYLNPDWQPDHGGLLRLHLPSGAVDVEPLLDRLVVLLSERVEHEVLPVLAPRLAITAWYYGGESVTR